jgi:hypothetical protein
MRPKLPINTQLQAYGNAATRSLDRSGSCVFNCTSFFRSRRTSVIYDDCLECTRWQNSGRLRKGGKMRFPRCPRFTETLNANP